jgi:hypothetical protein
MAERTKPAIVLVPGAWHTPTHFANLSSLLESHGYTVHCIHLPAVGPHSGSRPVPKDLTQDVAVLRNLVTSVLDKGSDAVVVLHSWAGIVAGNALTGLSKNERAAEGKKTGIIRCAYMSAFMAPEGVSLWDTIGGEVPPWWEIKVCPICSLLLLSHICSLCDPFFRHSTATPILLCFSTTMTFLHQHPTGPARSHQRPLHLLPHLPPPLPRRHLPRHTNPLHRGPATTRALHIHQRSDPFHSHHHERSESPN